MRVNDLIDQEFAASLLTRSVPRLFRQISTSALPTLTAVTLMRCVVILLDLTHAHVKQDSQEMDSHALVSRLSTILFVWYELFFEWTETTTTQESFVLFSPFTVKVLVRVEFILILVLTVSSKHKEKRWWWLFNPAIIFLGLKVNWFDTLTVKQ